MTQLNFFEKAKATPKILFFDLETLRSAGDVGGWGNVKKMGMACGVLYDTDTQDYHVYREDQVGDLIRHMLEADLVVGFNHIGFDYTVLTGYSTVDFSRLPSFDILLDVKKRLGHRLKLDSLAKATLGISKSADGLASLRWVKEGKMDQVIEYCIQDVRVTKELFEHGQKQGYVSFESLGQEKRIDVDWKIDTLLSKQKPASKGAPGPSLF